MKFSRRAFVKSLPIAYCSLASGAFFAKKSVPNILLVMCDDMGYSDLGCYGSEISTPNVDKLAAEGIRFKKFYNTARCCPTRASLLTGQYSHKVGMGWMTASDLGTDSYQGELNNKCVTVAEALKPAGYKTYICGKWHVTFDKNMAPDGDKSSWPCQRGFDHFYGHLSGGGGYYKPNTLTRDNTRIVADDNFYLTDNVTNEAVNYINEHFKSENSSPMFMYLAYYAPHRPLHVHKEDMAKYEGKYMVGWDKIRDKRLKKQKAMGLIDENVALSPREGIPAWDDVPDDKKPLWDKRMAAYAGQIECMDRNFGKVIDAMKKNGQLDNTIVLFLSDNGACAEGAGSGNIGTIGQPDDNESYRANWANVSDTPYRLYKHFTHEGGISSPLIIRWPSKIANQGGFTDEFGHVIDLLPTCLDVANAEYPSTFKGQVINQPDGISLLPAIEGGKLPIRPIFWEHEANCAVRLGDWKLVSKSRNKKPYEGPWELYNIKQDPTELNDVSGKSPEMKKKLQDLWNSWAKENGVLPLDNSGWGVKIKKSIR